MKFLRQKKSLYFSSGPTKKPYAISLFNNIFYQSRETFGRSHRSSYWSDRTKEIVADIRKKLHIPEDYKVALVAGSATGAMEMLLWNLIGHKTVDIFSCDAYSGIWRDDIITQLKIKTYNDYSEKPGFSPDYKKYNPNHDCTFCYVYTANGVQVPDLNWIPSTRKGLTICDATTGVFCYDIDWKKLDATGFSFQKGLGAEAGIGMIVLSKRAQKRLENFVPKDRPMPYLFDLRKHTKVFDAHVINTQSTMVLEDLKRSLDALPDDYADRVTRNFQIIRKWVAARKELKFLSQDMKTTSRAAPCVTVKHFSTRDDYLVVSKLLEKKGLVYDIIGNHFAPPCFRFWCGPHIEKEELERLTQILDDALSLEV
ncbi:MAG: phosphoserine aminotransferase [Alphaproteobacteria bacterium]|nr:MAG: phosphoserine aminotransferase [Alphaproteobacteria bacterium]